MEKENVTYEECVAELEKLVADIEDPSKSLSDLSKSVEKAAALIELCKKILFEKEEEINKKLA